MPKPLKILVLCHLALTLYACAAKPYAILPGNLTDDNNPGVAIYISNHGRHTGLILPAREINQRLPALAQRFGQVPYYEFGWGDAGYYQAKEVTFGLLCRAVIWPTDAVIHAVAVTKTPSDYFSFSEVVALTVTRAGFESLIEYVISSFTRDINGNLLPQARGNYGNSAFYLAEGKYSLANTCNNWTAKGLKSSGLDIRATFKITSGSIRRYLKKADGKGGLVRDRRP